MYTELIFGAKLKRETPKQVTNALSYMLGVGGDECPLLPDDPFFKCERWRSLFGGGSYYFAVNESVSRMWYDSIDNCYHISTRSNIKDYNDEIKTFLSWIKPHIEEGSGYRDMYAIVTYEEDSESTIHYLRDQ